MQWYRIGFCYRQRIMLNKKESCYTYSLVHSIESDGVVIRRAYAFPHVNPFMVTLFLPHSEMQYELSNCEESSERNFWKAAGAGITQNIFDSIEQQKEQDLMYHDGGIAAKKFGCITFVDEGTLHSEDNYECQGCGYRTILHDFNYCPSCGVPLII